MSRLTYVIKRVGKMDFSRMLDTAKMLHKKTGKSTLWLLTDMARCAAKYNAGYMDYKIAEMYRLSDAQRRTVITRGISNSSVRRMNDKAYWHSFDDKAEFNSLFRKWIQHHCSAGNLMYLVYDSTFSLLFHLQCSAFLLITFVGMKNSNFHCITKK